MNSIGRGIKVRLSGVIGVSVSIGRTVRGDDLGPSLLAMTIFGFKSSEFAPFSASDYRVEQSDGPRGNRRGLGAVPRVCRVLA